jgi:hypothetical protein
VGILSKRTGSVNEALKSIFLGQRWRLLSPIGRENRRNLNSDVSGIEIGYRNSRTGIDVCLRDRNLVVTSVDVGQIDPDPDLVRFQRGEESL